MNTVNCEDWCWYCEQVLSPRHEHDHWPMPSRAGGDSVVCVCINCHDLVDRIPVESWPVEEFIAVWSELTPSARRLVAKIWRIAVDQVAGVGR